MYATHNSEGEVIAQIERLELEARDIRRKVEHAHNLEDKRVLNRQLREIEEEVDLLRSRLP
jgi:hypothetical protein